MLEDTAPKQTGVVSSIIGYLICCVLAVPISSTLLFVGSGIFQLIAYNDTRALNPIILAINILISTILTYSFFGFYPTETGPNPINLWPWILGLGVMLFFAFRNLIRSLNGKILNTPDPPRAPGTQMPLGDLPEGANKSPHS